ncbi:MAG: hypothetical protein IJU69_03325 [Bacteroidales bacterium]|nr:hypothetical protein [Bacteroidales bacterium]
MPSGYIRVILPLRLGWIPCYRCDDESVRAGDRISVPLAGKFYEGVVYETLAVPDVSPDSIQQAGQKSDSAPVSASELKLWEFISSYYLCTLGEVYKLAYPGSLRSIEKSRVRKDASALQDVRPRHPSLSDAQKSAVKSILDGFDEKKTMLLRAGKQRADIFRELICRCLAKGQDVLLLTPRPADFSFPGVHVFDDSTSAARRRNLCSLLRTSTDAVFVAGSRNAVLLPWRKLGLVIVDEEHSREYKNDACAPRFNARDTALALARIQGASALLAGPSPSLESWYNVSQGRYGFVDLPSYDFCAVSLVDTVAEKRKNGMRGEYFSQNLLSEVAAVLDSGQKVLVLLPWSDTSDAEIEGRHLLPKAGARLVFKSISSVTDAELPKFELVALLKAEYPLSRGDYRADERMLQTLIRFCGLCSRLVIQSSNVAHPVFSLSADAASRLMEERREFMLPPFSREVDVCYPASKADNNGEFRYMGGRRYRVERHFFPKGSRLREGKQALLESLPPRAIIDVDPL